MNTINLYIQDSIDLHFVCIESIGSGYKLKTLNKRNLNSTRVLFAMPKRSHHCPWYPLSTTQ